MRGSTDASSMVSSGAMSQLKLIKLLTFHAGTRDTEVLDATYVAMRFVFRFYKTDG